MDVTKYLALLDQFLTKDIIGSCALNVMIDSEMSQKQKIDMICSIMSTISLSLLLAFINVIFDSVLQFYMTCIHPGEGKGGGYFLIGDLWGCVAGWGRIFMTGVNIMGSHFQQSY